MTEISDFNWINNADNVIVTLNSGLIVQINTEMISSFHDFRGILIGNCKLTQLNKETNIKDQIKTEINIEKVIIIFDFITALTIQKLIPLIIKEYTNKIIIGMFSASLFSYSTISLLDQKLYFLLDKSLKTDIKGIYLSIPLLFAKFCHHNNKLNKHSCFLAKIYKFDNSNQVFITVHFQITSLQLKHYYDIINPIPNNTLKSLLSNRQDNTIVDGFEDQITQLKILLQKIEKEITEIKMETLQKYKQKKNVLLSHHFRLHNLIKNLNKD